MMTAQSWEPRLTQFETRYESLDKRLGAIDANPLNLRDAFGADLRSFQESADRKTDRLLYLILGSSLTIMLAIFFLK